MFFENKKELFDDLWITKLVQWKWEEYPVVVLGFQCYTDGTPEELGTGLERNGFLGNKLQKWRIGSLTEATCDSQKFSREAYSLALSSQKKTRKRPVGYPYRTNMTRAHNKPILGARGKKRPFGYLAKKGTRENLRCT